MTKEEKGLVIQDLCARLPYGVKVSRESEKYGKDIIHVDIENFPHFLNTTDFKIETLRLYLRPLSSMTNEEKKILEGYLAAEAISSTGGLYHTLSAQANTVNFLYKRHFDINGLIFKGLALEAPSDMYKF